MDAALERFLAARDADADETLGRLLSTHATPIIRRVITSRLGHSNNDADDVCSQVVMQLMLRLRQGRKDGDLNAIDAFDRYIAAAAHHGCDHHLRGKYPLRWQLRNRIRYALEHDLRWAIWKSLDSTWMCGKAGWETRAPGVPPAGSDLAGVEAQQVRNLLARTFQLTGGPLPLWVVVDLAAAVWAVPSRPYHDDTGIEAVPDDRPWIDAEMTQRARAERLWVEIRDLPVRQRQALLLNLKDDGLTLFLATGTASLRAVAEALDMTVETLAALWNDLPLSDNEVATRLGCTRQQVINLRMSARKRLSNRLVQWS
jgi:DNA-directed RNA polymerase specialized sigma24 family protein